MSRSACSRFPTSSDACAAYPTVSTLISPEGSLEVLSQFEVNRLRDTSSTGLHETLRCCALAILTAGALSDNAASMQACYPHFDIELLQEDKGLRLKLDNAPSNAFVDGEMIHGIREQLSAMLRDLAYVANELVSQGVESMGPGEAITNTVFQILRNANALNAHRAPNMVVCWGGHSISRVEYDYSKLVGYRLGLRKRDICTGCGPGAMKGPMKGANVAHAKQRYHHSRYIGISEPGIIAAESPNPIVNELIIMPDIEKRLEAFVRLSHGIIVFPGGVGTAEEILYLLGILLHPDNQHIPFPVILTGPAESVDYFRQLDAFIGVTLGETAQQRYRIIIDDPEAVAIAMQRGINDVARFRHDHHDASYFNWRLHIPYDFQQPFEPSHEAMASLALYANQPIHELAANLRRAFSGIVAGNVKPNSMAAIAEKGRFKLHASPDIMTHLDALLNAFVLQQRMKLPGTAYEPCYTLAQPR